MAALIGPLSSAASTTFKTLPLYRSQEALFWGDWEAAYCSLPLGVVADCRQTPLIDS